ncbi:hypothetical protein [Bacillus mojavensis]
MKKVILGFTGFALAASLTGCSGTSTLVYKNKPRSVDSIEESIEDQLEKENPKKDLEVSIVEEDESSKSKKKSKKKRKTVYRSKK